MVLMQWTDSTIAAKRKRDEDEEKIEKTNHNIHRYFSNGPVASAPKPKVRTIEDLFEVRVDWKTSLSIPPRTLHSWQIYWVKSIPIYLPGYLPRR